MNPNSALRSILLPVLLATSLVPQPLGAAGPNLFNEVDLVSDIPGRAIYLDPNLVNPWGMSYSATSPIWVADNGTGVSTLYNGSGVQQALVVTIAPPAGGVPPGHPTGTVFNGGSSFEVSPSLPARFLFATEDGTISGWNPAANPTGTILKVDNSPSGAVYKGLAIGNNGSGDFLYAANFKAGKIDVFGANFSSGGLPGSFTDPGLPAGYAPFNIQRLGSALYVTYALADALGEDDVPGPGNGFVSKFDLNGNFMQRLISQGTLNSPWGLALAPADFGPFGGDLLVGNFGDGKINVFDPTTGAFIGELDLAGGLPFEMPGLWGLAFGNGGNGGRPDYLYFTAGIAGDDSVEDHGLFGFLAIPEPGTGAPVVVGVLGITLLQCRRLRSRHA